jgi:hypothetical protein
MFDVEAQFNKEMRIRNEAKRKKWKPLYLTTYECLTLR